MKIFRSGLPLYRGVIRKLSSGKGYGKKKSVRKIMSFFDFLFRSEDVNVRGHRMFLTKKGFEEISTQGIYGELDTLTVEKLIKPNDHVVDVGAAIGYYTLIFAKAVGKEGQVFAFEPKNDRFEILEKNILVNNYSNVILEKKAIMHDDEKSVFFARDDGRAGLRYINDTENSTDGGEAYKHINPVEIDSVQLDKYLEKISKLDKISFMKIDVDGPELHVLEGSRLLLKNKNLKIFMEWDKVAAKQSGCEPTKILDIIEENDFRMFYPNYKEGRFFEISRKELMEIPDVLDEGINMLFVKDPSILEKNGLL